MFQSELKKVVVVVFLIQRFLHFRVSTFRGSTVLYLLV